MVETHINRCKDCNVKPTVLYFNPKVYITCPSCGKMIEVKDHYREGDGFMDAVLFWNKNNVPLVNPVESSRIQWLK